MSQVLPRLTPLGLDDAVRDGNPARHRRARVERAFHVAHEGVAQVLAGEVQAAEALPERRPLRRDLTGSGERVRRLDPRIGRPVHEARAHEARTDAFVDLLSSAR